MTELSVIAGPTEAPIEELPEQERLGAAVQRARIRAKISAQDLADRLGQPLKTITEIERGLAATTADQLREIASITESNGDLLLECAAAWHRAVWAKKGTGKGVQLDSIEGSVATPGATDADADTALVKAHDELVFMANVTSHVSRKALTEVQSLRNMMRRRGLDVPDDADTDGEGRNMRTLSIAEVDDVIISAIETGGDPQGEDWGLIHRALGQLRETADERSKTPDPPEAE